MCPATVSRRRGLSAGAPTASPNRSCQAEVHTLGHIYCTSSYSPSPRAESLTCGRAGHCRMKLYLVLPLMYPFQASTRMYILQYYWYCPGTGLPVLSGNYKYCQGTMIRRECLGLPPQPIAPSSPSDPAVLLSARHGHRQWDSYCQSQKTGFSRARLICCWRISCTPWPRSPLGSGEELGPHPVLTVHQTFATT